ncbi:unnamed protein product [Anisakis simplex]|nr:unnamed protein product [Anisakis simplex]
MSKTVDLGYYEDYIHSNEIIYRDLKLENVVLDLDGHIQLVDFGFAKRLADDDRTRTICGTLQVFYSAYTYT